MDDAVELERVEPSGLVGVEAGAHVRQQLRELGLVVGGDPVLGGPPLGLRASRPASPLFVAPHRSRLPEEEDRRARRGRTGANLVVALSGVSVPAESFVRATATAGCRLLYARRHTFAVDQVAEFATLPAEQPEPEADMKRL
jgi:hypothetical protein